MKLMIDIPDRIYETVQDGTYCGTLYEELKNGISLSESEDCVSRQAVLDLPRIKTHNVWGNVIHESVDVEDIRQLPPVTPAEKVGQWEWEQESFTKNWGNWHCSECREIMTVCETDWAKINEPIYKYCPNCGANMQASPTGAECEVRNADSD